MSISKEPKPSLPLRTTTTCERFFFSNVLRKQRRLSRRLQPSNNWIEEWQAAVLHHRCQLSKSVETRAPDIRRLRADCAFYKCTSLSCWSRAPSSFALWVDRVCMRCGTALLRRLLVPCYSTVSLGLGRTYGPYFDFIVPPRSRAVVRQWFGVLLGYPYGTVRTVACDCSHPCPCASLMLPVNKFYLFYFILFFW